MTQATRKRYQLSAADRAALQHAYEQMQASGALHDPRHPAIVEAWTALGKRHGFDPAGAKYRAHGNCVEAAERPRFGLIRARARRHATGSA